MCHMLDPLLFFLDNKPYPNNGPLLKRIAFLEGKINLSLSAYLSNCDTYYLLHYLRIMSRHPHIIFVYMSIIKSSSIDFWHNIILAFTHNKGLLT